MDSNYVVGHRAEVFAAEYLNSIGFKIINLNWKNKRCEIDIVAKKDNVIYFVEVKYRKNNNQGQGMDYITQKKLQQMGYAAEIWVTNNGWEGEYQLAAVELYGDNFLVSDFVTDI